MKNSKLYLQPKTQQASNEELEQEEEEENSNPLASVTATLTKGKVVPFNSMREGIVQTQTDR